VLELGLTTLKEIITGLVMFKGYNRQLQVLGFALSMFEEIIANFSLRVRLQVLGFALSMFEDIIANLKSQG